MSCSGIGTWNTPHVLNGRGRCMTSPLDRLIVLGMTLGRVAQVWDSSPVLNLGQPSPSQDSRTLTSARLPRS